MRHHNRRSLAWLLLLIGVSGVKAHLVTFSYNFDTLNSNNVLDIPLSFLWTVRTGGPQMLLGVIREASTMSFFEMTAP